MNEIKNENISIGSYKGHQFVSMMAFIPSDFHAAKSHIYSFKEVLDKINVEAVGKIQIRKQDGLNYKHILAVVDNVDYLKLSYYPETGWIVGFSNNLPKEIGNAKCVVNAMIIAISNAEDITFNQIQRKLNDKKNISSKVIKRNEVNNNNTKEVVEAFLNNKLIFKAEKDLIEGVNSEWVILNIMPPSKMDISYMVKYQDIIKEMLVCLK